MQIDQRISLQKLEVFCLVVELGGVGRAAEHLFVAQSVVSAHLRTLQERIGAQLLYRDGRRLRLTEAGEATYSWAQKVLSRREELARQIDGLSDGRSGHTVIASSMSVGSYMLPPVLARFRRGHPGARITLDVSDPERALHTVEIGRCDFAILICDTPPDPRMFTVEPIGRDELVLVAGVDTSPPVSVTADDLREMPFVCSPAGLSRRAVVDAALARMGVDHRNVVLELGHPEAMKRAARDGLGVAVLLRSAVRDELDAGLLREIAVDGFDSNVPIMCVQRIRKRLTPIQSELLEAVRDAMEGERAQAAA
jgi:DNA-binding transcriptional LysR family regulator